MQHQEDFVCVCGGTRKPGKFYSIICTRNNFTSNKYNYFTYAAQNSNPENMKLENTKTNLLFPVSNQFLLAHSRQVVSRPRSTRKKLWERPLQTDFCYLILATEDHSFNSCNTSVPWEEYLRTSELALSVPFHQCKNWPLYTVLTQDFKVTQTLGAHNVRCAFHSWKMDCFYFFKFSSRMCILASFWTNLVSRNFTSESSDLIRHRQFPVLLRCVLEEYYFSW